MDLIRLGIVGMGRGGAFLTSREDLGYVVKAICDICEDKLEKKREKYKLDSSVKSYTSYDEMLEDDIDAVILCNYFNEHAPLAIKALKAGKHVLSECTSASTMAECVALCRAVEESGKIYMLAENYPYSKNLMELSRIVHSGELGEPMYGEGEYNHPMSAYTINSISPGVSHWRNNIPSTYYCTHALAPLMVATETMPVTVNGFSVAVANDQIFKGTAVQRDPGSVIILRMNNGAIFRLLGTSFRGHSVYYRIHGSRGAAETDRVTGRLRVWHDEWDIPEGQYADRLVTPDWPEHGDLAKKAGHGGGDFWTTYLFTRSIFNNTKPFLNVYRGVSMSAVGILAWKSALKGGIPFEIPDFTSEESRKKFEDDDWNPIWKEGRDKNSIPPSSIIDYRPSAEDIAKATEVWEKTNYIGLF